MFAPRLLDDPGIAVVLPLPHLLQQKELQPDKIRRVYGVLTPRGSSNTGLRLLPCSYRFWSFNKDLGPAQLELILVHVDRVEEVKDTLTLLTSPRRP